MLFANAVFLRLFGQCINKRHGQFPSKAEIFLTAGGGVYGIYFYGNMNVLLLRGDLMAAIPTSVTTR